MSASIHVSIDNISPRLEKLMRQGRDVRDPLLAMGTQVESIAQRAFDDPGMRITAWQARKKSKKGDEARPLLIKSTALRKSFFVKVNGDSVEIGNPMPYAAIHQFGGKTGRGHKVTIPARPFFPFNKSGAMAPWAMEKVAKAAEAAMRRKLEI